MAPLCPELPPATTCELMVIAPSDMAVQLLPSPPSARLKSSEAVSVPEPPQVTATVVTFAEPTVPVPLPTVQVCPDGWVFTVTAYAAPLASCVGNAKEPFAVTVRASPPLSFSTTVPDRPETVPPTEYVAGGLAAQVTATVVTFAEPTVPVPLPTVQVCPDGWVFTVTAYAAPLASCVGNAKEPFAVTVRASPPLSFSTTVPDRPETVPPTEYVAGGLAAQVTATVVTFAEPTVPVPLPTVQVCPDGWVFTVTAYAAPLASCVGNAKEPFAVTVRASPPLSFSTTVPDRPETGPPTEYVAGGLAAQVTATVVTFAEPTVPVPLPTVQVCPDGWVFTVTAYAAPLASCVGNAKEPFAVTVRASPPLSFSTTVPDRPETVPPMV